MPKKDFDAAQKSIGELKHEKDSLLSERENLRGALQLEKEKFSSAKNELIDTAASLERARERLSAVSNELVKKSSQLDKLKAELKEKSARLAELEETYSDLEAAFAKYKKLSETTKFALEGVFGAEKSPTNFLAGVLQGDHLESLFDYVADALNSGTNPDEHKILRELVDFAFEAVNNGRREKIFARLNVQAGDPFDSSTMRKTSDSKQSGTVEKILLAGYKYIRTGKTVKPSLVFLE